MSWELLADAAWRFVIICAVSFSITYVFGRWHYWRKEKRWQAYQNAMGGRSWAEAGCDPAEFKKRLDVDLIRMWHEAWDEWFRKNEVK